MVARLLTPLLLATALAGCVIPGFERDDRPAPAPAPAAVHGAPLAPGSATLRASGYAALTPVPGHTEAQSRLLAMRAARLDAYRALAEQVSGLYISGDTSIAQAAAGEDTFNTRLDAFVRGARVVRMEPRDGLYEVIVEIDVDPGFTSYFLNVPRGGDRSADAEGATTYPTYYYAD